MRMILASIRCAALVLAHKTACGWVKMRPCLRNGCATTELRIDHDRHARFRQQWDFGFDARGVAKRFRHAAIFGALESLQDGETMRFVNDHDPPPLGQIRKRYGQQIGIAYVAREPGNIGHRFNSYSCMRSKKSNSRQPSNNPAAAVVAAAAAGGCSGGQRSSGQGG